MMIQLLILISACEARLHHASSVENALQDRQTCYFGMLASCWDKLLLTHPTGVVHHEKKKDLVELVNDLTSNRLYQSELNTPTACSPPHPTSSNALIDRLECSILKKKFSEK
jgi:hypothetical protein